MPVLKSQRTYPLTLTADSLNTGIVSAFEWASENGSTDTSNGKDHSGNNRHFVPIGATPTIVTTAAGNGRDTSIGRTVANAYYDAAGASTIGLNVGTGDFSIYKRIRTPTQAPASTTLRPIGRIADSAGNKIVFQMYEVTSTSAWHWQVTFGGVTNVLLWNSSGNPAIPPGTDTTIHVTRISGVVKCYVNGVLKTTTSGNTTDLLGTNGASHTIVGNYTSGHTGVDAVYLDDIYWNRGLSDAEVTAHAANPYSYYANNVGADSITPTSPTTGSSVSGAGFTVAGTYAGGTNVTLVEASFNGGAYVTIDAAPSNGTFSGTMTGQIAATGTLTVRSKNGSTVVATSTVTNVTVASDAISFNVSDWSGNRVVANRMYQRNGSNQASVRIVGSYSGTPTTIQYQWKGGAWTTLVASPTGGVFDQTVTLQGPGQGPLNIRFSNSTSITASLPYVGVGDVFMILGQSNHVGKSASYVQPVAPASNSSWKPTKLGKNGVWQIHQEDSANKFDDGTGAIYSVHADTTPQGSYFGALATKIMEGGVPVAFVPTAMGSTSLSGWTVNTATTSLYGAALAIANKVASYKAVLWWQGEFETQGTNTKAQHVAALNTVINDWNTRTGAKWFVWAINAAGCGSNFLPIHDAIIEVGQTNTNVLGYADLNGSFTGDIHFDTTGEINEIASRTFASLNTVYSYTTAGGIVGSLSFTEASTTLTASGSVTSGQSTESNLTLASLHRAGAFTTATKLLALTGNTLEYDPTGQQGLIMRNNSASSVTVNIKGDQATSVDIAGAGGNVFDLSSGFTMTLLANTGYLLKLDKINAYLVGNVSLTASTGGVIAATLVGPL